jgi:hypothetical protein
MSISLEGLREQLNTAKKHSEQGLQTVCDAVAVERARSKDLEDRVEVTLARIGIV